MRCAAAATRKLSMPDMDAKKYRQYLATNVISEGNIISYRMLSRALKVHSNHAKEMLFEFHRTQNERKKNSLHATYLVCGTRKSEQSNGSQGVDPEDEFMHDSFVSNVGADLGDQEDGDKIPVTSIVIVGEEKLEACKTTFQAISSIHVYSIEPGKIQARNIQTLSECNRKVRADYASEDALETWKQYGTIHNPATKRRTARVPPPAIPKPAAVPPSKPAAIAETTTPAVKAEGAERPSSRQGQKTDPKSNKPIGKTTGLKREDSNLFKSFAKAGQKTSTAKATSSKPRAEENEANDEPMEDASADEGEDFVMADSAEAKEKAEANRQARAERESELRRMMDEDHVDEDMADAIPEPVAEDESFDPAPISAQKPAETIEEDMPPAPVISNGRRRGRRRVMKKKTTKDAEGYLVTKEELTWESFSEDEPQTKAEKAKPIAAPIGGSKKRPGPNKGGNIMSFFAKK